MKKCLSVLLVLGLGCIARAEEAATPKATGANKPNIIFILSDDLGSRIFLAVSVRISTRLPTWMRWRQGE